MAQTETNPDESGYNGYTNYPTFNVSLWLDNDETLSEMLRRLATYARMQHFSDLARATTILADDLQAWLSQLMPEVGGMADDLLGWALEQVNWQELAANALEQE